MTSDGTLTIYTNIDEKGLNKGMNNIEKRIGSLNAKLRTILSFTGLVQLGKDAISAASDLQEYENVAYNTFKDLTYMLEEFTATSIQTYGLSRVTATKIASGYQAMGASIGLANDEAAEMSLTLTGLVGDMSSFRNISSEQARTALAAVYTGETETLKQYGIMLQEVNLQQFAYQQGINKSIAKMTAAEKVQLRYDYVVQALNNDMGDFVRTQENWANQIRVLEQNWNELLMSIGQNIMPAVKPVIQALNLMITKVIDFMNVFSAALGKLMGWQYETYEWVSGTEDGVEAMEDLADATDDAGSAAKKALAPFDDLNVLQSNSSSSSDSDSTSSTGSGSSTDSGYLKTILNSFESDIDSFYELGEMLNKSLTEMLKNIDWASIYKAASNFGKNLAEFLNGLISPELFYQVGRTIANALNTAIYTALSFGTHFDWSNLGLSIATGINSFFENFDFTALAKTIKVWVNGIFDLVVTTITNIDYKLILNKIAEFIRELDWSTIFKLSALYAIFHPKKIAKLLLSLVQKVFSYVIATDIVKNWLMNTWVKSAIVFDTIFNSAINIIKEGINKILSTKIVSRAISSAVSDITSIKTTVSNVMSNIISTVTKGMTNIKTVVASIFSNILTNVNTGFNVATTRIAQFFNTTQAAVKTVVGSASILAGLALAVTAVVDAFQNGATPITVACAAIGGALVGLGIMITTGLGPISILIATLTALTAVIVGNFVHDHQQAAESVAQLSDELVSLQKETEKAKDSMAEAASSIKNSMENASESIRTAGEADYIIASTLAAQYNELANKTNLTAQEKVRLKAIVQELVNVYPDLNSYVDEETGLLTLNSQELANNIELLKERALAEAYMEAYKDLLVDHIKNEYDYTEAVKRNKESWEEYKKAAEQSTEVQNLLNLAFNAVDLGENAETVEYYRQRMEELGLTTKEINDVLNGYADATDDVVQRYKDAADNAKQASLGIQQANHDLTSSYQEEASQIDEILNAYVEQTQKVADMEVEISGQAGTDSTKAKADAITESIPLLEEASEEAAKATSEAYDSAYLEEATNSDTVSTANSIRFESVDTKSAEEAGTEQGKAAGSATTEAEVSEIESGQTSVNSTLSESGVVGATEFKSGFIKGLDGLATDILNAMPTSQQWTTTFNNIKAQLDTFIDEVKPSLTTQLTTTLTSLGTLANTMTDKWKKAFVTKYLSAEVWEKILRDGPISAYKTTWEEFLTLWDEGVNIWTTDYLEPLFAESLWREYGDAIKNGMYGGFKGLVGLFGGVINKIISAFNTAISNIQNTMNNLINSFNEVSASMDGPIVPNLTGTYSIPRVSIPALAKGAVIPPNKEFMAILGDQKSGTNIEAPLDTIVQAMEKALGNMGGIGSGETINLTIDGQTLARLTLPYQMKEMNRKGYNVNMLTN